MMSRSILRLRRLYRSLVLFCGCPCSRCVAYRRSYHCVEQPESMFEQVVFRCQFLPVLVKCRPSSPDSISDFGRLLLQERNHLAQVSRASSSCQYFEFYVSAFSFFSCVGALVAQNFRLFWMNPETHFFSSTLLLCIHVSFDTAGTMTYSKREEDNAFTSELSEEAKRIT